VRPYDSAVSMKLMPSSTARHNTALTPNDRGRTPGAWAGDAPLPRSDAVAPAGRREEGVRPARQVLPAVFDLGGHGSQFGGESVRLFLPKRRTERIKVLESVEGQRRDVSRRLFPDPVHLQDISTFDR